MEAEKSRFMVRKPDWAVLDIVMHDGGGTLDELSDLVSSKRLVCARDINVMLTLRVLPTLGQISKYYHQLGVSKHLLNHE